MGWSGRASGFGFLLIVVGLCLAWSCLRAMFRGEDSYDRESQNTMLWSSLLGLVLGVALAWGGVAWLAMLND
jgi:hypothetical protein